MNYWMTFWTVLLAVGTMSFAGLLFRVSHGTVRELRKSLDELREETRQSTEHADILDEAV